MENIWGNIMRGNNKGQHRGKCYDGEALIKDNI